MKIGPARVLKDLTVNGHVGGDIIYMGEVIGRFVTHGDKSGKSHIVYASRISGPVKIEAEGTKKSSMINKVAKEIAAAMSSGNWPIPDKFKKRG